MRDFKTIQTLMGDLPDDITKAYLIGSTGAGKSSLVQHILGTTEVNFPTTTQRRTTVAPTEYVINRNLHYKSTILLKKKEDLLFAIEDLIFEAIKKSLDPNSSLSDISYEFEQSPDERFKLKHIVSDKVIEAQASILISKLKPLSLDINDDDLLENSKVINIIEAIKNNFLYEIESNFHKACPDVGDLFDQEIIEISGIHNKNDFISKNKELLKNDFGSISALVEYIRIEGDLISENFDKNLNCVLIDGEGIGHSYSEKRDTLSTRHYDYFDFCNHIILIGDAEEAFATGGQSVIESICLNGYQDKFQLVFSKTDKLDNTDINGYIRRNLHNLSSALSKQSIDFNIENKDTFKFGELNKKEFNSHTKGQIRKLLDAINSKRERKIIDLEYDYSKFYSTIRNDEFHEEFIERLNNEHWAVLKAFSKRLIWLNFEYRHLKPLSWVLTFIMRDINLFLIKNNLVSEIYDSQNKIKRNFSKNLRIYIYNELIVKKSHLWQQAYEMEGRGSHQDRKEFIYKNIISKFLPSENSTEFESFREKLKQLLIISGALEMKEPIRTTISKISITNIFGQRDIVWNLQEDINLLVGKNGTGKSTVLNLLSACISNDKDILEYYHYPYVEITIKKEYEHGENIEQVLKPNTPSLDLNPIIVASPSDLSRFSNRNEVLTLDTVIESLTNKFSKYQRNINQIISNKTEDLQIKRNSILENISDSTPESLLEFKDLTVEINRIKEDESKLLHQFKEIMDDYFKDTDKKIIIDDENEALVIELSSRDNKRINLNQLSSGEKQLLIIFLNVIINSGKSSILIMDEPESSLHVEWQSSFIDSVKELNPKMQIVSTTHNPLILLNRNENEIGVIDQNSINIDTSKSGTKFLDISSILIEHFNLSSLIGSDMKGVIKEYSSLQLIDQPNEDEIKRIGEIKCILDNSFTSEVLYNRNYYKFLKFLRDNKGIDFNKFERIESNEMDEFLSEFGDLFND
ncbi:AAA family ATPase [Vibrio sp. 10N.222.54.F12]|uniref:AAA family ATPase n=1 Tax=Vibrio TaxID=662 RepID=UPI000C85E68C|nr:ATP-binding protein [Vibrio tasmaniensis]PML15982.1 hypothetical protein BCT83_13570 [Vibrio tasmaniensis]PML44208.1 hypothetical protein BCT76_19705 [Vibrio tasmaniensis]